MLRILLFSLFLVTAPAFGQAEPILVIGDSISAGYGIEVGAGWVDVLQRKLEQEGYGRRVINASISGDTSAGGVARIGKALKSHAPGIVIIELGANDGLRGLLPRQLKANLKTMIDQSKAAGAKVLLLGMRIPPNYGKRYTEMFYDVYRQVADEEGVAYVPFLLENVALQKSLMQQDGLHPNEKAQPLIAEAVWSRLAPVLGALPNPP
ncbi:MAG: arylesterase [Pseudomonadota bacterium]